MKPKIYVYRPRKDGECAGVAYTADGELLAVHVSSTYGFFRADMGFIEGAGIGMLKHAKYVERYPDGFELIEVIGRDALQALIDKGDITGLTFEECP